MSHTPNDTPDKKEVSEISLLRQELTQADTNRRALLVEYPHDSGPIIKTLFAEASRSTLEKVEFLLSVDLPKEGAK
jgi:hypothetical protein